MANSFRQPILREQYDLCVSAHRSGHRDLTRGRGNSFASNFWRGYDGIMVGRWDRASKQTPAYACWCAGRDVRKMETE